MYRTLLLFLLFIGIIIKYIITYNNVSYVPDLYVFFFIDEPRHRWLNIYPAFFILYIFCTSYTKYKFDFIGNNVSLLKYGVIRKGMKIICHFETIWHEGKRSIQAEQPLSVRRGCVATVIHVTNVSALVLTLLRHVAAALSRRAPPLHWFYCYKA